MPTRRTSKAVNANSPSAMRSLSTTTAPNLSAPFITRSTFLSPFSFFRRSPRFYFFLSLATLCLMLGLTALLALTLSAPASSSHAAVASTASPPVPHPVPTGPPSTSDLLTLATYPHDSSCFTQGLEWYNNTLYESCGMYGQSNVRAVDVSTGGVVSSRSVQNRYFAEGLTVYDGRIYQLTWQERDVLVYSPDLTLLHTGRIETDGWGITHTATHIITTDGTANLYFRAPDTLELLYTLPVTRLTDSGGQVEVAALNELEYVDGLLYANVWMQPVILCIEPTSGRVVHVWNAIRQWKEAGGDNYNKVVNGVAYRPPVESEKGEKGKWYMTGKYWPKLYEVDLTLPTTRRQ